MTSQRLRFICKWGQDNAYVDRVLVRFACFNTYEALGIITKLRRKAATGVRGLGKRKGGRMDRGQG